jgi:tetratricopeptide (TPR) repeat protein
MTRAQDPSSATSEPVQDGQPGPVARSLSPNEQQREKADSDKRLLAQIWTGSQRVERDPPPAPTAPPSKRFLRTGSRLSEPGERLQRSDRDSRIEDLSRQLADHASELGPHAAATIQTRLALAQAHMQQGQATAAIPLLEQAIADLEPATTEQATTLATARAELGRAYLATRQPQKAIALYETLLADESGASTRSQLLGYRIKLAVAHRAKGNVTAAVEHLHALSGELEGDSSQMDNLLECGIELATTNVVAGRPRDGVCLYENALTLAGKVHGAEHCTTLGIRLMLARAHQQAGQRTEAARLYELLGSDTERALGPGHSLTRQVQRELATLLRTPSD